jgi:hypothetical protein
MSTYNSLIAILPNSSGKLIPTVEQASFPLPTKQSTKGAVVRQKFEHQFGGLTAFFRECWRRMMVMNATFADAELGDGAASRERSEERAGDEEAWSRMDDEGCPNGRQQSYTRQNIIRIGSEATSNR